MAACATSARLNRSGIIPGYWLATGVSAMDHQREYDVVLTPAPEGGYVVSVPEFPDVHTEGETREEALAMAKDAIEGYLEAMRERGWSPKPAEHERVVVAT
jgi:predicted RNase H-like HicB family nuclease